MTGYLHGGFPLQVLKLFKTMVVLVDNLRPYEYTLAIVFSSCSKSGNPKEERQCHGYVLKTRLVFHLYVKNALIYMYAKYSDVHEAFKEGIKVLSRMVGEYIEWDNVTYVTVFGLCACLKNLKLALQAHRRMLKSRIECDVYINGAIISMYGKCGNTFFARKVFNGLQSQHVVLWTGIMSAYFQNKHFEEIVNLFFANAS
ncbi:hypothetical protein SLA2020_295420 [Shorea laevis]